MSRCKCGSILSPNLTSTAEYAGHFFSGDGDRCCIRLSRYRGGSLSVPFMTYCNVKIQHAIGTSAAIGLPIAISGTLGYLISGWNVQGLPPYTIGYIYLPAVVLVAGVSFFTAPLGAKLAHSLPVATLKRGFAVVMFLLSVKMLYTVISH